MKAVVWKAVDQISVDEVPEPDPRGGEVVVRVGYAGICGSDLTIMSGKHPRARAPLVLGHEFMGTVHSIPAGLLVPLRIGQRVVVNPLIACKTCRPCRQGYEHICERLQLIGVERNPGALTGFVSAPQPERIHPIPDSLSDRAAALIEPLAVAVHAVDYAALRDGDRAVILGAGPIGLLIAQVLRARGAGSVWLSEMDPNRLQMARRLGFQTIDAAKEDPVAAVLERTGGQGAEVTFEAAGVPATATQVIPMTGIKGRIIMTAIHKKPAEVLFRDMAYRELSILGTRIYANGDFEKAIELAGSGKVDLEPLITHVFPLERAVEAFAVARDPKVSCKVLLQPS